MFLVLCRYGSGIVVAKLADGRWSAPSAVTISGVGWGLQVGAELTDGNGSVVAPQAMLPYAIACCLCACQFQYQ